MSLRLLTLPFRAVGFVVSTVFVVGMLETFGMLFYMQWSDEAALDAFVAGGITPMEALRFVTATPDRTLVAGGLAVLGVLMVLGDGGGGGHHDGDAGGFGGGFGDGGGGDGGGGGGDGGE